MKILVCPLLMCLLILAACSKPAYRVEVIKTPGLRGTQQPYKVNGERYDPLLSADGFREEGIASWYGKDFHGRKTSNGETYNMHAMTAAHKTLPMNVHVRVSNLANGRSAVVRINDRGPFIKGRVIDLSYAAANQLDIVKPGTAPVRVEALGYKMDTPPGSATVYRQPDTYDAGTYTVQVGAFAVEENARRLAAQLQTAYGAAGVAEAWVEGRRFYRVRAGRYPSLELANAALPRFEKNGFPNSFVVAE